MAKRILIFLVIACSCIGVYAQTLAPITWTAFGLTFDAPKGIVVEEDTEDTFLLNNNHFYIALNSLNSEEMVMDDMDELLKGLADDDGLKNQSGIISLDLQQFHLQYLKGMVEEDPCCYACLMTKDAGSVFYLSIFYNQTETQVVERILKSFKMEEDMEE